MRKHLNAGLSAKHIAEKVFDERLGITVILYTLQLQLCDECLAPHTDGDGTGCDNMTVIIVHLGISQSSNATQIAQPSQVNGEL